MHYLIYLVAPLLSFLQFQGMLTIFLCFTVYALSFLHAKPLTDHPAPRTFPVLTTDTKQVTRPTFDISTVPSGCEYEGKIYEPYESFAEGNDGQGWCHGLYCNGNGNIIAWDDFNCGSTTVPLTELPRPTTFFTTFSRKHLTTSKSTTNSLPPKTTFPPTAEEVNNPSSPRTVTRGLGCEHEGKFFASGESFGEGTDGEGWCYGLYCDDYGNAIPWDNFNCGSTTTPSTAPPRIRTFFTTFSRKPSTTPKPTTNPSPPKTTFPPATPKEDDNPSSPTTNAYTTVPRRPGCEHEGKFYAPGESFGEGTDGEGWCYGLYCDYYGNAIPWDNFNCGSTTTPSTAPPRIRTFFTTFSRKPSTTPKPTTNPSPPKTTFPPATPKEDDTSFPPRTNAYTTVTRGLGCEHEGKFFAPGESFGEGTDGKGWCYGLYCDDYGNKISWDNFNCGTTTALPTSTFPATKKSKTTTRTSTPRSTAPLTTFSPPTTTSVPFTPIGCMHEGKFYPPGEVTQEKEGNWCHGLICDQFGEIIAWDNWNCKSTTYTVPTTFPRSSTLKTTAPTTTTTTHPATTTRTSRTPPNESPGSTSSLKSPAPRSTLYSTTPPSMGWCFFNGRYFENGDIISRVYHAWSWCSGWYCNDGKVDSWSDFNCPNPSTLPKSTQSTLTLQCYYEGVHYNHGEVIVSGVGSGDCEGLYCSRGVVVQYENRDCGSAIHADTTTTVAELPTTKPNPTNTKFDLFATKTDATIVIASKSFPSTPKPTIPTSTQGSDLSPCFHEERYYEEGDLVTSGNNWCSGWICKDGVMVLWENCEVKRTDPTITDTIKTTADSFQTQGTTSTNLPTLDLTPTQSTSTRISLINFFDSTSRPITDMSETTDSELSEATTHTSVTDLTTRSTTDPTSPTKTTPQTEGTSKPPEPKLCLHDGKYYEEGDILSRDFDGDNWCSGWYCKNGRLIPVDCSDLTSSLMKEDTLSPKLTLPQATPSPEPAQCFHEGRYYEEGDLATSDNNWCTGLLCKDGVMVLWDDCKVMPKSTKSSQVTQIPVKTATATPPQVTTSAQRTPKPAKTTPKVFESSTETPVTVIASYETAEASNKSPYTTKIISYTTQTTPEIITKSHVTSANVPIRTSSISHTVTEISDNTARFPDSTTMTTNIPTRPQQTTPTRPPQTTKPESQKCLYEGKIYPPGEITKGVLADGRCYGVICDISGVVMQWVTDYCTPTEPPTADIKTTLPGCVYNGKYYPPGRISRISNNINKWCLDVVCTDEGKIVTANNVDCDEPTTKAPTKTAITCLYNGMIYSPGVIKEGADEWGWCYKVVCQDDGQLYLWGDWHCSFNRRPTTTAPPETTPSTTCTYDEREYPVGEITRGSDASGWCYGVTCKNNGEIVLWGSFGCRKA